MFKKWFRKYSFNIRVNSFLFILLIVYAFLPASHLINARDKNNQSTTKLPYFIDVTKSAGVDLNSKSISAIWVDYDEDGFIDLFVGNGYNQKNVLYRNLGNGVFNDVTKSAGLVSYLWSSLSTWIDFDNDGDLDFYLHNTTGNQFFENTGKNSFTDISKSMGFPLKGYSYWADFNNDGWLDFFVNRSDANREQAGSPPNLLYKNLKNGEFEEIAVRAGVADEKDAVFANWIDYNNDGLVDLYVTNNNHQSDHLFKNNGNETFTDVFSATGINENNGEPSWADFNNDGWIDLFIADGKNSKLYKNEGNGKFTDLTLQAGLEFQDKALNSAWVDFDNDGYLDLHLKSHDSQQYISETIIFHNNQNGTFTKITQQIGFVLQGQNFNVSWADYDNDGDPDLYMANRGSNILYQNQGNNNNWIKIDPLGNRSNRDAIGARVKIVCGSLIQYRGIGLGQNNFSPTRQTPLFGLGKNTTIDSIIIHWPSGMVQDTSNIAVNQKITIKEPALPLFTNITKTSGIADFIFKSFGVTFVDFDQDNDADLFICNHEMTDNLLFRNMGFGKFKDATKSVGLDYSSSYSGIGWGDFNNDGFGDIYAIGSIAASNLLLQNTGRGSFLNISKSTGTAGKENYSTDLALGDFDNNGFLDIYVGNDGSNILYFNKGNFKFKDVTVRAGVANSLISVCTAGDYDNDGDLDIYVGNNRGGYDEYPIRDGWTNRLYRNNDNGTFTDVAEIAGVQDMGNSKGCCFGDYDNDGDLDLYVGNDGNPNSLFQNNGDGTFTNVAEMAGVGEPLGTHAVLFTDFDNDGFLDIYAAGGSYIPEQHEYSINKDHPDKIYHNNGDGTFSDISQKAGIEFNKAATTGIASADYDNDGDMDLALANSISKNMRPAANVLLRNNGNDNYWIHFKLIGRKSNKFAIGARVKIIAGDLTQIREVGGGIGYGCQNSLPVEFGLGGKDSVDQVIIRWPSGIVQKLKKVTVNQINFVEEPFQVGPLQMSAAAYNRFIIGFFILMGICLLTVLSVFIFIPVVKNIIVIRKKKKEETTRKIKLTLSKKTDVMGKELISQYETGESEFRGKTSPPILIIKINTIKFRNEYLITHLIEPVNCDPRIEQMFKDKIEEKTPYPVAELKIQRLMQKIETMWLRYADYIETKQEAKPEPIILMKEIGELIYNYFGLTGLLRKLFSMKNENDIHLNFILDNSLIPWHWAYDFRSNQFLCEKFALGVTVSEDKIDILKDQQKTQRARTNYEDTNAIILYGDWKGHFKELSQVEKEVQEIEQLLISSQINVNSCYQDSDKFVNFINKLNTQGDTLRLIHYSGHIENNMLDLGEKEFLAVNFLREAYGVEFFTQPIVFLNGCRSGEIKSLFQKHDNLATEFLDLGASSCIVTHFQIPEIAAKNFATRFYHFLINEKSTVALSLQKARLDMAKPEFCEDLNPDYDITRYFYNLFGKTTEKFF